MKSRFILSVMLLLAIVSNSVLAASAEFPGREIYPASKIIETAALKQRFNNVVIVDVRSKYEYETLRIKNAINIPLTSSGYIGKMRELGNKNKTIVVYCNGRTCMKSYKAEVKARRNGVKNIKVYDAGVMDWAKAYPKMASLLGETPLNPASLISKSRFTDHLLAPKKFAKMALGNGVEVIDVRDPLQRMGMGLFIGIEKAVALDNVRKLNAYIQQAAQKGKTLLIYDETGKQVQWLMYRLAAKGLKNFYFMKGGTRGYFEELKKRLK